PLGHEDAGTDSYARTRHFVPSTPATKPLRLCCLGAPAPSADGVSGAWWLRPGGCQPASVPARESARVDGAGRGAERVGGVSGRRRVGEGLAAPDTLVAGRPIDVRSADRGLFC